MISAIRGEFQPIAWPSSRRFLRLSASGAILGGSEVGSDLPTRASQLTSLQINVDTGAQTHGFGMFDTNNDSTLDLAYLADDRATAGGRLSREG
jgi:hypothetical protein